MYYTLFQFHIFVRAIHNYKISTSFIQNNERYNGAKWIPIRTIEFGLFGILFLSGLYIYSNVMYALHITLPNNGNQVIFVHRITRGGCS
jgi:hypothetical protein